MKYFFSLILFALLFVQCQKYSNSESSAKHLGDSVEMEKNMEGDMTESTKRGTPPPELDLEKGSKIIKEGHMEFEVDNLKKEKIKIDTILKTLHGYYENEQFNSYRSSNNYSLRIRIPNSQFDSLVLLLEHGAGKLISKNISAKDVTEEYVDLNIRLNNNLAYLEQYNLLLKKAKSIKEILEVQEKIRQLETEIESKKGRIKYLDSKVNYSTLNLELREYGVVEKSNNKFISRIGRAFEDGFEAFLNFIVFAVNLWPFLLLIILFWVGRKRVFNLIKRK